MICARTGGLKNNDSKAVRLQKYLSEAGIASRRKAEDLITQGAVSVNGEIAQLGCKVEPGQDDVRVDGQRVRPVDDSPVVLILNKPKGYICSHSDPHNSQTIYQLLPRELQSKRLICAGRLDKDSEGMLILTNDGEAANAIMHPSFKLIKRYRVTLNRDFDEALIPKMLEGVRHDGEVLKAEKVIPAPKGEDRTRRVEVHLMQGRKREIRRIFEAMGFFVKKLRRVQIGSLPMKGLGPGEHRILKAKEIDLLFQ